MTALVPIFPLLLALASSGGEDLDDAELSRRIRDGDRRAFRAFFDRYHGLLYGYVRRRGVGPAAAEDLVQQAFVAIWEKRRSIDPDQSLRAFLFKIGYNRAINHFRDTAKFADADVLPTKPSGSDPEAVTEYVLMRERLLELVERLPERRRAVFELTFFDGITYREAAEVLGISVKTVENQMSAALRSLREAFDHYRDAAL